MPAILRSGPGSHSAAAPPLDPQWRGFAEALVATLQAAATKAAANHADPAAYPLPADPQAIEWAFVARFRELSQGRQDAAAARAVSLAGIPGGMDLHSATPVEQQARLDSAATLNPDLPAHLPPGAHQHPAILPLQPNGEPPPGRDPVDDRGGIRAPRPHPGGGTPPPPQAPARLALIIPNITCIRQTDDPGDDEIVLGGTVMDESAQTTQIDKIEVGDFWNGAQRAVPGDFAGFNLRATVPWPEQWPRTYNIVLVMAEEDMGGVADLLNKIANWVKKKIEAALDKVAAGELGSWIGALVGGILGWVVDQIFGWLGSLWGDDIFAPITDRITLDSAPAAPWTSDPVTWELTGYGGKYELTYRWQMR